MGNSIRETFNLKDPLIWSQIWLIVSTALGLSTYFDTLIFYAIEIPVSYFVAFLCFSKTLQTAWRYLADMLRQCAGLTLVLIWIFIFLHVDSRVSVVIVNVDALAATLFIGAIYYLVRFLPLIVKTLRSETPDAEWYRMTIARQWATAIALIFACGVAPAIFFLGESKMGALAQYPAIMALFTALTSFVRMAAMPYLTPAPEVIERDFGRFSEPLSQ